MRMDLGKREPKKDDSFIDCRPFFMCNYVECLLFCEFYGFQITVL